MGMPPTRKAAEEDTLFPVKETMPLPVAFTKKRLELEAVKTESEPVEVAFVKVRPVIVEEFA